MGPVARVARAAAPRPGTPDGRRTAIAGAVYVASWVVGLVLAPAAPPSTAPAPVVHAYYLQHGGAVLVQSVLVHGLAALALAVLAAALPRATRASRRVGATVRALGWSAAAVSLLQTALGVRASSGAAGTAATTSRALFEAVNTADTVKLVLLAGFVAAATVAAAVAGMAPLPLRIGAAVLVVLLPLGGAAFVVPSAPLTAALYVSLPLLLLWAGATAVLVGRRAQPLSA